MAKSSKNPAAAPVTATPPSSLPTVSDGTAQPQSTAHELAQPRNLTEAKLRVMAAVPYVRKRGQMGTTYSFLRDTDVVAALRGPMIENGIALCGPIAITNRRLMEIQTGSGKTMFRTDADFTFQLKFMMTGETEDICVTGEGADNLDKSSNKAMSAARKYALVLGFNLTTGEDPDQFDEEGRYGGEADDNHTKTQAEAKIEQKKPQQPKEPQKEDPKRDPSKKPSNLPATGEELKRRLVDYDGKLAAQKIIGVGELVNHVTQSLVAKSYPANITEWSGAQIELAVEVARQFEQVAREGHAAHLAESERQKTAEASALAKKAESDKVEADRLAELTRKAQESAEKQTAAKQAESKPPVAQPSQESKPATSPAITSEERYQTRLARMGISKSIQNLDKFRELYTKDAEMTDDQKRALESSYWANRKRITEPKPA